MYKISLIVRNYNKEKTIRFTLDSIIKQSIFKDIEVIIVDDNSTDKSFEIIKEYMKYDNFKIIRHKKNLSGYQGLLSGIRFSTSNYISFIDVDDAASFHFYEELYENMKKYELEGYNIIQSYNIIGSVNLKNIIKNNNYNVILWCKLFKRELFNNILYSKIYINTFDDVVLYTQIYLSSYVKLKNILTNNYFKYNNSNTVSHTSRNRTIENIRKSKTEIIYNILRQKYIDKNKLSIVIKHRQLFS